MLPRQRQRKFHRRSRNGCSTCKSKHIRCDENKPLCTYCLRHGGTCGYPDIGDPGSTTSETGRGSTRGSEEPRRRQDRPPNISREEQEIDPRLTLIDTNPNDPFLGTGHDMPHKSRALFQLFMNTRVLYTTRVERDRNSFIVHRALSHPGFLHAALLLTTLHWAWCTGDVEYIRVPYLYHKLQAIRFVNEQLRNPDTAVNDGTIAAVSSLALVENALGSIDTVSSHLRGLAKIKELQGEDRPPERMGLLQRMIVMAARSVSSRPVWDILDINRTDFVHQSIIISLLRVALRPIYSISTLSRMEDSDEPLSEVMARKAPPFKVMDSNVLSPLKSVDSSRSGFIACYFYLYIILRESTVDSFITNWFIEQLLTDVSRTEEPMQMGQYSQSLWFWTVMFGACVTTVTRANSKMEQEQMKEVRDVYLDKIRFISRLLHLRTWKSAKSALRRFAWEDGFDGEVELQAVWEEAVGEYEERRPTWQSSNNNTGWQVCL